MSVLRRNMGGHGHAHGHAKEAAHEASSFPKWIVALENGDRTQVILGSIGLTCVVSLFFWSILMARGEHVHTLSDDWKAANKDYMKFQKMNPITGISKGL